jgi:hypothetical protein
MHGFSGGLEGKREKLTIAGVEIIVPGSHRPDNFVPVLAGNYGSCFGPLKAGKQG